MENDDGTITEDNVDNMPEDQTKEYGKDLILSSNIPVRKGWTFQRWSTNPDPDGGGQSYNPSGTYTNDQDGGVVTLYAIWKKDSIKHTIVYDTQGGYNPQAEISGEYMISANGKNLTQNGDNVSMTTDTSDQSKWIIERYYDKTNKFYAYKIFNKATGKGLCVTGNKVGIIAPKDSSLWDIQKQSDGTIQIEYIDGEWAVDWNADNYLYCDENTNYGSFTLTGDQKDYPSRTKSQDENIYINNIAPERKGYKFVQWSTDPQGKNSNSISDNTDEEDDSIGQKFTWSNIDNHQTGVNKIQYGAFAAKSGHKYQISGKVTENTGAGKLVLNAVNTDGTTDYGTTTIRVESGNSSTFSFDTSFTSDANPYLELRTEDVSTITGELAFTVEDLKIMDVTTGKQVYATNINGNMGASDVTFTAQWNPWKHQVVYDANANNDTSVKDIPEAQIKTADEDLTLSDNIPTRNGYTFLKWSLSRDGEDNVYAPGAVYQHDQDGGTVTLYAIWTPNTHIVHYDKNVSASSKSQTVEAMPVDQTKTFDQNMNVASKVPTRSEYKFLGWKAYKGTKVDQNNYIGEYQPGDNYDHDQNGETVTLFAQWVQLYTVKYDGNASMIKGSTVTGSVASQTQGQDESVNLQTNNFKNNSGIYKNWSVGKDAYLYAKRSNDPVLRNLIHEEGTETNHDKMQNELREYNSLIGNGNVEGSIVQK